MENFWKEKKYLPADAGYKMFSGKYFLALFAMLIIMASVIYCFGRLNKKAKEKICRVFAVLPFVMEVIKFIVLFSQDCYTSNYYPIGLCSLIIYIYPVYAFTKNEKVRRAARVLICNVMLPGGIVALLFPNWIGHYPFFSYFSLHSYIWHTLMLVYPVLTWLKDRSKLKMPDIIRGDAVILVFLPVIIFINYKFGTNYWFLAAPTDNHPFAAVYKNAGAGVYFGIFVLVSFLAACLVAWLQNIIMPRFIKEKAQEE